MDDTRPFGPCACGSTRFFELPRVRWDVLVGGPVDCDRGIFHFRFVVCLQCGLSSFIKNDPAQVARDWADRGQVIAPKGSTPYR